LSPEMSEYCTVLSFTRKCCINAPE